MATAIPANRASFTVGEIAAGCEGRTEALHEGVRVEGVVTDSRAVKAGQLYVALRGERFDGHSFLAQAYAAGAAAALVERADGAPAGLPLVVVADTRRALGELARLHRARWGKPVVAITGSAGKTTTKELTAAALRGVGQKVLSTVGNLNNDIGLPMTLFGLTDAHDVAVVEIGTSGPGEIAWLTHIAEPNVGVVTTVALAHVEKLRSLAEVADEKCALLAGLPRAGTAIYGADSAELSARVNTFGAQRVLGFGLAESAELRLVGQSLCDDLSTRLEYTLEGETAPRQLALQLCGQSAAIDALAALAVVQALHGVEAFEAAGGGIASVTPLPGRMRPRRGPHGALVIDDTYNANPASMLSSLGTLAALAQVRRGRAIAALADMAELGDHAKAEHERIGRAVVELGLSDVFFCGPDMAHAAKVAQLEVKRRRAKGPHVQHVMDPLACVSPLTRQLDATAAVLVKGSRALAMERVVDALCPNHEDAT
ncbi:MAG: UDP-N-acetylmuramoyl-tripeptide--D-alanyl-D-alanine ligase [Polyangiales bacterium]